MNPLHLVVVLAAVTAGAFVKSVTGMGLPLIAIPAMATVVGAEEAVVVMALPAVVTNTLLLWRNRADARHARHVPAVLAGGVVGAALGTWLLDELDDRVLAGVLAAAVLTYAVVAAARPGLTVPVPFARVASPAVGVVGGVMHGASGISAPVIGTWFHAVRLPRGAYVFAITTLFQVLGLVQLVGIAVLGLYTPQRLLASVLTLVPVLGVFPLGMRVAARLPRHRFDKAVLGVLVASAAILALQAATS